MALDIVAGTPGLWRDPEWQAGMPGLYALVVGISAYPHLEEGSAPAPDAFGLGQLGASANTAASLFDWLRQDFLHEGLPVVWCQLLLSPTAAEKTGFEQRGLTHYALPDNNALRTAIQRWTGQVPSDAAAARKSRTLFFFSGHGVQSNWRALLLPSDYLDPGFGAPQLQNCISTRELQDWMEQCPVAEHLALIDACRNEFSPLASRGATANACFPLLAASTQVPRTAASLAATSPGKQAFQAPNQPHTLFGQAVLESLRGIAGGDDARLEFRELVDYVKPRVNALLKLAGGNPMDQTVRPRIEGDDALVVTELAPPSSGAEPLPPPPPPPATPATPATTPQALPPAGAVRPRAGTTRRKPVALEQVVQATQGRFDPALAVREPIGFDALRQDFGEIHRRMGHEYTSHLWREGTRLLGLDDGHAVPNGLVLQAVERDDASALVQVDLELAPRQGGVLLLFEGAPYVQRERLAVALPTDAAGPVPIRLHLRFGQADAQSPVLLQKLEARLGPSATDPHYERLWTLMREADLGSLRQAAERADPEHMRAAAQQHATTAVLGAMLLQVRAGRIAELQAFTRNLKQQPQLPDGAVLWAESLRHAVEHGKKKPFGEAAPQAAIVSSLVALQQLGLPFFVDSLELAERLIRHVLRQSGGGTQRDALLTLQQAIARLYEVAQPDGHFPVLAGLPRPAALPGDGALTADEMRALLLRA